MKQRGSVAWLILAMTVLGITAYIILQNVTVRHKALQPSPRQDALSKAITYEWSTYRNTAFGFEFKHPSNRVPYERIDLTRQTLIPAGPESVRVSISHQEEVYAVVEEPDTVTIVAIPDERDAHQWFSNHIDEYVSQARVESISTISFEGKKAIEVKGDATGRLYRLIIIQMPDYLIVINQNAKSTLLDDVVKSFKITDGFITRDAV